MKTNILNTLIILSIFCCKLSMAQGWEKNYGDASSVDYGYSVIIANDGNYIISGTARNVAPDVYNYVLLKVDTNGNVIWKKIIGGWDNDILRWSYDVKQTFDKGYIMTGRFSHSRETIGVAKTDSLGNLQWEKSFGSGEGGHSVVQTTDSGYVITGENSNDLIFLKLNQNGDSVWSKIICKANYQEGLYLQPVSSGGYICVGFDNSMIYLIRTNSNFDTLWTKVLPGYSNLIGNSIQETIDGGYIITGKSMNSGVYLAKTNSVGDTLWTKTYLRGLCEGGQAVIQTSNGNYVITGANSYIINGMGIGPELFVLVTNSNGDSLWSKAYGSGSGYSLVKTANDEILITGIYYTGISTGVGSDANIYLIKIDSVFTEGQTEIFYNSNIAIYPNPTNNNFTVSVPHSTKQILILNSLGQIVQRTIVDRQKDFNFKLDFNGIYFIQIITDKKIITKKIIVSK